MGCFASCIGPKEKSWLTCMLLPTLHLYINFPSSCKDLNYEPPPKACRPRIKDFVLLKKNSLAYSDGQKGNPISPDSSVLSSSICWLTRNGGRWKGGLELWLRARLPRTIAPSFSLLATFRNIWENIRNNIFSWPLTHLLKCCIRKSIGGNVELCQVLVELLEENLKLLHRVLFTVLGRKDEDNVGANLFHQGGCGDVPLYELGQGVYREPTEGRWWLLWGGKVYQTHTFRFQWTGWW